MVTRSLDEFLQTKVANTESIQLKDTSMIGTDLLRLETELVLDSDAELRVSSRAISFNDRWGTWRILAWNGQQWWEKWELSTVKITYDDL